MVRSSLEYQLSIALLSLLTETVALYYIIILACQGLAVAAGIWISLSPFSLLIIGGASIMLNFFLLSKKRRLLTYVMINLTIGGLGIWFVLNMLLKQPLMLPKGALSLNDGLLLSFNWFILLALIWQWYRGWHLAKDKPTAQKSINHFERTTLFLLSILIISGLLKIDVPHGALWFFICLIANLSLLSLSNTGLETGSKHLLAPILFVIFLSPVYLLASGVFSKLSEPTMIVINIFKPIFILIRDAFLFVIIKLLHLGQVVPDSSQASESNNAAASSSSFSNFPPWVNTAIYYVLWGLLSLIIFIIIGALIYALYRLILRLKKVEESESLPSSIFNWRQLWDYLLRFIFWLKVLVPWTTYLPSRRFDVVQAYHALVWWGGRRRIPKVSSETPYEYLLRLSQSFPHQTANLQYITDCYVQYSYGRKPASNLPSQQLTSAVRNLFRHSKKLSKQAP